MDAPQINACSKRAASSLIKIMLCHGSVFVKRRQPVKIATYFAFCASYFDKLVHRLYYKVNLARFKKQRLPATPKLGEIPVWKKVSITKGQ